MIKKKWPILFSMCPSKMAEGGISEHCGSGHYYISRQDLPIAYLDKIYLFMLDNLSLFL